MDDTLVQFYPTLLPIAKAKGTLKPRIVKLKECMGYGIGGLLSLVVSVFARSVGWHRDRAFYPTVLIVIASYYVLFAVMGVTVHSLIIESIMMTVFLLAAQPTR